ncbi:helix-turn-helix domain-containing protein [Stenotrophomonas maltophilia]|uniref:helix-turn-helix domain-containing protein n=1 Tax=Stenotrophomonas maltophilia TaxID=40324 RepID=UPI0009BF2F03
MTPVLITHDSARIDQTILSDDGWLLSCPAGNRIALTKTERLLLHCLARSPGRVVTREQLIGSLTDNIHDYDPHRLESLLHRLRRKVRSASGRALPLRDALNNSPVVPAAGRQLDRQ